jgi:ubiquinone/menaquinone biosynthesis C-methylase UbiE
MNYNGPIDLSFASHSSNFPSPIVIHLKIRDAIIGYTHSYTMTTDNTLDSSASRTLNTYTSIQSGSTPQSTDSKTLVEHGYNVIAPAYLASFASKPTSTRLHYLNKLLGLLPPGANVLELGCGAGVPCTQALIEHSINVTAVDISSAQIALARQNIPQATLIHADMMALSFEPNSFDAVVGFYSIFHLPKEEQGAMIRRIRVWLRDGGKFLCNLATDEGDQMMEDWLGARMFWSGLGVQGNRNIFKRERLQTVEDEVVEEMAEQTLEKFHWLLAVKRDGGDDDGPLI